MPSRVGTRRTIPASVLSGRTNDEVAAAPDRVWTEAGERRLDVPVPEFAPPTDDELAALDALGARGTVDVPRIVTWPSPISTRCCVHPVKAHP